MHKEVFMGWSDQSVRPILKLSVISQLGPVTQRPICHRATRTALLCFICVSKVLRFSVVYSGHSMFRSSILHPRTNNERQRSGFCDCIYSIEHDNCSCHGINYSSWANVPGKVIFLYSNSLGRLLIYGWMP